MEARLAVDLSLASVALGLEKRRESIRINVRSSKMISGSIVGIVIIMPISDGSATRSGPLPRLRRSGTGEEARIYYFISFCYHYYY